VLILKEYDQKIEALGREKYGHTSLLRQVKGVGPIPALAYVSTLANAQRFAKSRDVGPYLGLVPKQEDSGESQPQLGISKAGDTMVRKLLVGSAQYILGRFGPDTDLRRYGLRLCERGGKNAKKRAAVAVARKLEVLLHRLWVSGEGYEPLHHAKSVPIARLRSRPGRGKHAAWQLHVESVDFLDAYYDHGTPAQIESEFFQSVR
jgi:transposase